MPEDTKIKDYREIESERARGQHILEYIEYNPDTGLFRWKVLPHYTCKSVWRPGAKSTQGYYAFYFKGNTYLAHRLAILCMTGSWPLGVVDHINGDKRDNRSGNLRDTTYSVNALNTRKPHKDSTSGCLGVDFRSDKNKWRACICIRGIRKHLGYFNSQEAASEAYQSAKDVENNAKTEEL